MSKFTKDSKKVSTPYTSESKKVLKPKVGVTHDPLHKSTAVINYMAANSWTLDPIATLRMVAASSIFGEPAYYESENTRARKMEQAIDAALDYNFGAVLDLAVGLRNEYYMRLNPAVIMVRAAIHPNRSMFTSNNPGVFSAMLDRVARRPDDLTTMIEYFIARVNGGKGANNMPGILKRAIANRLSQYSKYQIAKYANRGIGLIDVVRLTHANSPIIDELMKTGAIKTDDSEKTWRTLSSAGFSWGYIINSGLVTLSHSDLLFQMRNIMSDLRPEQADKVLTKFLAGVEKGMLFPYNYWTAYKTLERETFNNKQKALDALIDAIDISVKSQPSLGGNVAVLVDNSGSARSGSISAAGNTQVYEVGNLSGVMTAMNADCGVVGVFGDRLQMVEISKRVPALEQVKKVNDIGNNIGHATENGIWLFWRDAINKKEFWDTVIIYSDMQAGTGGLYGLRPDEYRDYIYPKSGYERHIDVYKLVDKYRSTVNPKVNVFCVQIAGYDNSIMPENRYRAASLSGWTGKENLYAAEIINIWDQVESQ